jgi:hypothetical protein
MADKAKHAYGSRKNLEAAIQAGKVDAYDILFLNGEGEAPAIGWVDKDGNPVIVDADLSGVEAELATKANAEEVEEKLEKIATDTVTTAKAYTDGKIEAAVNEHLLKNYEIVDVPNGTLVDHFDKEIRVMCPANTVFTKQSVGANGDANCYYATFKTYAPNDEVVGYIEHLNGQTDAEILTDLKTDEYGRKYQPTWLALARYDETTDVWTYYGAKSNKGHYIGYDYQIDWYNVNGVMISSDSIRINLSNEDCHFINEPYYVGGIMKEIDTMIEEKIAEVEGAIEIVEF